VNDITAKEDDTMKRDRLIRSGAPLLLAGFLAGCAGFTADEPSPAKGLGEMKAVGQREAADLAFRYRQQAAELREAARRYELEAEIQSKTLGGDDEQVRRTLEAATSLRTAASQADETASEYRRQVPHAQVY